MFEASVYIFRRDALRASLSSLGITQGSVVLIGNDESPMNYRANAYPFRQDSSFLYFVGIALPGLACAIDLETGESTLYGDDLEIEDIVWTGPQPTTAELAARSGIRSTRRRLDLEVDLQRSPALHYLPSYRAETRAELSALTGKRLGEVDAGASIPLVKSIVKLREIKSEAEVAEIETAVAVSVEMHRAAMATARAGMLESDVAARVAQVALSRGALSFPIIATTKGATLHDHSYGRHLEDGGLFLLDAGAETSSGYAGDLSSTFPIASRFTERQLEVYRIVLAAHAAACSSLRPERHFREVHLEAARAVASGLKELGLMRGDIDEAVAVGAHALFFPHGVGHQIGLDVHDMENLGEAWVGYDGGPRSEQFGLSALRLCKPLKVGMVHSIEPGIYFIPQLIALWRAEGRHASFIAYDKLEPWLGLGGIRNEEDWLVTSAGARRLGPRFDKSPAAIEALRA